MERSMVRCRGNEFVECIRYVFLNQIVDKPTRSREGQTSNILDLILVNEIKFIYEVKHSSPIGKSDHETLTFILYTGVDRANDQETTLRYDLNRGNYHQMRITLGQVKWTHLLDMDVDNCWNYIKSQIHGVMSKYIPTTANKKNINYTPRWMNKPIKRIIQNKYVLYKKYLQARSVNNYNKYLHVRNEATKLIRKAKRNYERILAEKVNVIQTNSGNTLNAFFCSVFIKENLNDVPITSIGEKSRYIYTGEIRVTLDAILHKINKLNRSKAQGPDEIPPRVIYELGRELSVPLSILFLTNRWN